MLKREDKTKVSWKLDLLKVTDLQKLKRGQTTKLSILLNVSISVFTSADIVIRIHIILKRFELKMGQ